MTDTTPAATALDAAALALGWVEDSLTNRQTSQWLHDGAGWAVEALLDVVEDRTAENDDTAPIVALPCRVGRFATSRGAVFLVWWEGVRTLTLLPVEGEGSVVLTLPHLRSALQSQWGV